MTATMVLMPTVAHSCTLISVSTPATGDGISASTLSVEISNSGSSRATDSPTFFSHFVRVPSVIDSPIWGMITSVAIGESFQFSGALGAVSPLLDYKALEFGRRGLCGCEQLIQRLAPEHLTPKDAAE